MMGCGARYCILAILVVGMGRFVGLYAEQVSTTPSVVSIVSSGKACATAEARPLPPREGQVAASCALTKKTLRDGDGQVISGIAVYPWREKSSASLTVVLYALVPKAGAPNRWLNGPGDGIALQRAKQLAKYTVSKRGTIQSKELKELGIGDITIAAEVSEQRRP
jgi:hypothetical protein